MKIPIVLTAFGTTTKAQTVYQIIDAGIRQEFTGHEVRWAYSSRMVRDRLKNKGKTHHPGIGEVLDELSILGHQWAVVQSLHLIAGHEFYRLLEELRAAPLRTSVGLPLLSSYEDYLQVAQNFFGNGASRESEALVLVGHGTDHPAWSAYPALQTILRHTWGPNSYVGAIEGHPSQDEVVRAVSRSGLKKVRLIPLMLVAGVHFLEDLSEGEDSWRAAFQKAGFEIVLEPQGIGAREEILKIFIDHVHQALEAIPESVDVDNNKVLEKIHSNIYQHEN